MRRILAAVVLVAAIPLAVYWALKTPAVDSFLTGKAPEWARRVGVELRVGRADFDPWGPSLRVTAVEARSPEGGWTFRAEAVALRLRFFRSLSGTLHLEAEAAAPRLEGEVVLPAGGVASEGRLGRRSPAIVFETLLLRNGGVDLALPALGVGLRLPRVDIDWVANRGAGTVQGGAVTWRGVEEPLELLRFEGERRFATVKVSRLEVRTGRLGMEAKGRVGPWRLLDLDVVGGVSLRDLPPAWLEAARLDRLAPLDTAVSFSAHVGGTTEHPEVRGTLGLEPGRFSSVRVEGASALWALDREGVSFDEVEARTSAGGVSALAGRVRWAGGLALEAQGTAIDYDLRAFMGILLPEWFPVGGRASGSFAAKGPLAPELALECAVDLEVRDVDVTVGDERTTVFTMSSGAAASRLTVGSQEIRFGATRVDTASATVVIPSGRIRYLEGLWLETEVAVRDLEVVRLYVPRDLDARGRAVGRFGGPYRDLVFEYDVDLASVLAHGEDLGRLTGRTRYDLHDLTLQGAALTGGWGEVRATGTAGLHAGGEYRLDVEAEVADFAALVALAPAELSLNPAGLGGAGWARGRLVGPLAEPEFAGEAGVEGLTAFGYAVSRAAARGRASAVAWTLEDAEVNAYGGVATARGGGDLERFGIQGELAGLRLEEVAGAHGAELPIEGELTADFLARGPYGSPTAELSGSLGALRVLGRSQGDVAIRARYEGGRAEAEALAFEGGAVVRAGLDLSGELPLTVDARFLDLPWGALPLDVLPPSLHARSVTGRLRLDGLLGGEDRRLWVQGSGALEAVRWQGVDLGRVVLEGAAGAEGARASVRLWEGEAVVSAVLPPPPDGLLEVGAVLEGFALSRLRPLAPVPEGRVTARVRAGLSPAVLREAAGVPVLDALAFLEGTGSLTEVAFPDGSPGPEWRFRAETKEGKPELRLESDGVSLRAAAEGAPGGDWSLEALLEGFSPGRWVPPGHPLESLRGAVTARGSARGLGLELAEASATGSVEGLSWGPALPSTWEWTAAWRGGRGSLEAREARGTAVVAHRSPEGELTLRAELQGLSLEEWLDYPGLPEDFSGEVEGQGSLSWAPDAGVSGRLDLTRLRLEVPPAAVENVGPVRVSYEAGEARAESLRLEGSGLTLTAAGSLRPGEEWALDLEGSLDLGALRGWVPAVRRGSGTARAELELRGPWEAPRVMGPMVVEPGATLYLEPLGQPVEDLDASAFFDARQGLVVEWLDAQVGPGRVHLEGSVGLDGLRPGRLRLLAELRNIAQERPPRVTSLLDADLLFTGTAERPEIRGDIRLKEFLYEQRVNLKTLVFEAIQRRPREVRGLPEAGTVFVDLAVRGDDNLRVENNLADLSLAVDLRARGHLPRPALWGRVDVQEGIVRLRAVEYEVLRSSVEFLGETRPVPRLDLHARTSVRQYDVSVDIFGPLDDYQVTLASLPPLPHNDIVALLTVGTTAGEMQDAQALTAAEAASFLTGRLQDELESEVGEILGFDQFQIDPVYSPATQTTVPRVTVGKAISRSLFARYSAAFGGEAEQDFEVQYSLTRRLSLLGTWNDRGAEAQGSFGGELRVRFPFR